LLLRFLALLALLCTPLAALAEGGFECLIEPAQTVSLRSTVAGVIETIPVHRGDRIRKGQVLVMLESSAERAALDLARYKAELTGPVQVAQMKFEYAQRTYIRRRDMHAEKLMSAQDKDEAEGALKTAEAELHLAQENHEVARLEYDEQKSSFNHRTLRSPLEGVVADQLQYEGELVEPSDPNRPILKLAQIDPLRVHVVLPRSAFGSVRLGMTGTVTPEAPASDPVKGVVTVLDSVVDGASGTFSAFLDVPNPKQRIPAGIRCRASFPIAAQH
jgi:RND family efflux transporter MFP subunit